MTTEPMIQVPCSLLARVERHLREEADPLHDCVNKPSSPDAPLSVGSRAYCSFCRTVDLADEIQDLLARSGW